jgi:hypothetical protein
VLHINECVCVTLVVKHAKHIRHIILLSVTCLALPRLPTLSHKWHDFWEMSLNTKCVSLISLQLLSEIFLTLSTIQRDITKIYIHLHVNYLLLLSDFNQQGLLK